MYAEGLIAEAIDLEKKQNPGQTTGLLVDCMKEYAEMLNEIELRKTESKSIFSEMQTKK